ncbi:MULTISPECIES: hypothetical protein [unclassified Adlercreutzia]|uniref:hypothetical protein n=1 Tax=unclassified Adlercreutzia TaxID=2636013 RepID=UPI0013ECF646|nr:MULTISPECIES: hypothetical protein [unclassified Adlercreutzia]
MTRDEFMALESPAKADALNALMDAGKTEDEAMAEFGITKKDLMRAQVFYNKTAGRFKSNAVGGYSNFHSDVTADSAK